MAIQLRIASLHRVRFAGAEIKPSGHWIRYRWDHRRSWTKTGV